MSKITPLKKRKASTSSSEPSELTVVVRRPPFSYVHLQLRYSENIPRPPLDILTARAYLTSALTQFLGLAGAAISVDILKVEAQEVWIRVPAEDLSAVVAAVGGWAGREEDGDCEVGWQVRAYGDWLGALVKAGGEKRAWGD
ncbi:MAG: hypothetical protein M1829_006269 [Trizodia sp. TS-e1964]|nr:MAG: hypothetical protein M1829_006269 [Trizodia sp. TS-e1964]